MVVVEAWTTAVLIMTSMWFLGQTPGASEAATTELERYLQFPGIGIRAVCAISVVAAIVKYRRQSARSVGLGRPGRGLDILIGMGATVAIYAVFFGMQWILFIFFPEVLEELAENTELLLNLLPDLHVLAFAPLAIVVGIYEEVVFRGFLMTRLRRALGGWPAAIGVSTLLFTGLHALEQAAAALPLIAFLSLVFSVLTVWRRSLVPAIVAHALFDCAQFIGLSVLAGDS